MISKTRVKVECVFGQVKGKFACLSKCPDYQPDDMVHVVKACFFLWNFGLLCRDNKGYNPDDYVIDEEQQLNQSIEASVGGKIVCDIVCQYLWKHC